MLQPVSSFRPRTSPRSSSAARHDRLSPSASPSRMQHPRVASVGTPPRPHISPKGGPFLENCVAPLLNDAQPRTPKPPLDPRGRVVPVRATPKSTLRTARNDRNHCRTTSERLGADPAPDHDEHAPRRSHSAGAHSHDEHLAAPRTSQHSNHNGTPTFPSAPRPHASEGSIAHRPQRARRRAAAPAAQQSPVKAALTSAPVGPRGARTRGSPSPRAERRLTANGRCPPRSLGTMQPRVRNPAADHRRTARGILKSPLASSRPRDPTRRAISGRRSAAVIRE